MSNNTSSNPLIDGKFLLTMVLVLGAWLGWQSYMSKKYPDHYKDKLAVKKNVDNVNAESDSPVVSTNGNATTTNPANTTTAPELGHESQTKTQEQLLSFEDAVWKFEISSRGMALKNINLKDYTDRTGHLIAFAAQPELSLFATSLIGRRDAVEFQLSKSSDTEFLGTAVVDGMKITKIIQVDSKNYSVLTKVRAENLSDAFTGFSTGFSEQIVEHKGGAFFMPQFEHQEFYINHEGKDSRTAVAPDKAQLETYAQTKIAGFGSQYFAVAILDKSPVLAEFKESTAIGTTAKAVGVLTHNLLNKSNQFAIDYVGFAGPKSFEILKSIDSDMTKLVNLGFFMSIAKGILWLMKTIHAALGNWGIAIIILTIIVRILVLPFNLIGYKQMKAMTKIQPAMKALREKYKSEPQKLNQEMLVLMKEAKANPLGGCLPMFLQIPIFFALYQVIGQSIDLYQAPFVFWITDLSLKDPFYVLPALMGVTMFIQQKITPNTMEPAQQKIMMFMPIFFTFLMVSLPSGLTLYIFISSIFGVLQQLYFMRDNNPVTARA